MFGLGVQEVIVLGILAGGMVAVVTVVLVMARGGGRVAELERENRRLRDERGQRDRE